MPSAKASAETATSIKTQFLPSVTPEFVGNDPDLPFPEWSDQEINAEKWDVAKGKPTTGSPNKENVTQDSVYFDPQQVLLPSYFLPHQWKRPVDIFPNVTLVIYNDIWDYSNFIKGNEYLLHSEFIRHFISSIGILEHLGFANPWKIEGLGAGYVPNTEDVPWRGWHHIYSSCKAGKGQHHNPQVNNIAKYIVRLYWMGSWRKIIVDDLLPVDDNNRVLLPVNQTQDLPQIELWSFLLCKALLKIASLTWNDKEDLVDCDIISLLTGWLPQKLNIVDSEFIDVWDICRAYSDHFTWPEDIDETDASSKKTSKSKKNNDSTKISYNLPLSYCLVGTFTDLRGVSKSLLPDFARCLSHSFLVEQSRNIPLIQPAPREELARWKKFRWLAWAIAKGIYTEENFKLIKCLKIISIFQKYSDICQEPSDLSLDIKQSAAVIDELIIGGENNVKDQHIEEKSKDKDKKAKAGKEKNAKTQIIIPESPSVWGDFNTIQPYLTHFYIYTKPSLFVSNIKISDFKDKAKEVKSLITDQPTLNKRYIWPNKPNLCRNEPFYLFIDSLDYNFLMVNLSQAGNKNVLLPPKRNNSNQHKEKNIVSNNVEIVSKIINSEEFENYFDLNKSLSHITIEKYNWKSEQMGDSITSVNTLGSKSTILQIQPGRTNLRLWIKSNQSFIIQIISDVFLTAGTQEHVFGFMQNESRLLIQTCFDVGGYFGKLVQSFGEADFQEKLISFHASYKPENAVTKIDAALIRNEFCEEIYNLIHDQYGGNSAELIRAMRVLLIDFGHDYFRINNYDENALGMGSVKSSDSNSINKEKLCESAAVQIQAFFKMIYIKSMFASRTNSHPKHTKYREFLKKLYKELFSVEQRVNTVSSILRKILLRSHKLDHIRDCYDLYHDLQSVVHLQAVVNTIKTSTLEIPLHIQNSSTIATLIPIGRYVFYVNCLDPIVLKFCINCDCDFYCLRIFNNDSGEECKRFTLNSNVGEFVSNPKGYTVLIYGNLSDNPVIQSKFVVVSLKRDYNSALILTEKQITLSSACDTYIPNVTNLIGKCQIFIKSEVSFRFTSSLDSVKVKLRCLDESGNVCDEVTGVGCIILPILDLTPKEMEMSELRLSKKSNVTISRSRSVIARESSVLKKRRRSSDVGSILSVRRSRKRSSNKSASIFERPVYYVVEMYVLENSWPLTLDEWLQVDDVLKRELVGPELFPVESQTNIEKPNESFKKSRIDKSSVNSNIGMEKPFWCIQAIHNKTDEVNLIIDRRRQEEIKNIKRGWFANNFDRYVDALEARKTYLESQYALLQGTSFLDYTYESTSDYNEEIDSELTDLMDNEIVLDEYTEQCTEEHEEELTTINDRTLTKPIAASNILPPLDYTAYALLDEEFLSNVSAVDLRHVDTLLNLAKLKTGDDIMQDKVTLETANQAFLDLQDIHEESMMTMRLEELEQLVLIQNWYQECRDESECMMKTAYSIKEEYITELLTKGGKDQQEGGKGGKKK